MDDPRDALSRIISIIRCNLITFILLFLLFYLISPSLAICNHKGVLKKEHFYFWCKKSKNSWTLKKSQGHSAVLASCLQALLSFRKQNSDQLGINGMCSNSSAACYIHVIFWLILWHEKLLEMSPPFVDAFWLHIHQNESFMRKKNCLQR